MEIFAADGLQPLPECALVRIEGPDALSFLHGQLTHAITGLSGDRAAPAAYCTAQGRLLANGVLWRAQDDCVIWMVARDLADGLIRRLRMFVLRTKVTISLDEAMQIAGAWGAGAIPASLHAAPAWTRASTGGADWIMAPMSRAQRPVAWRLADAAVPDEAGAAPGAWPAQRLAGGWPWIQAASQDLFLPASLDMDLNGTIDFTKGCYPGQEVIARSHYRGTVKRRLACGTAAWTSGAPAPGPATDLYPAGEAGGRPSGRVIESAVHRGLLHVAAEITLSDLPAMRYAVGAPDGAVLDLRAPSEAA
ncbi:YgfZ/GcvT domain-containing protein [Castellaniella sp.]|uniref:CAF17-like 4Fe-4S cluster assembly/insertion protein YgfZ n=1 Tax=Castellaniella sp. TaxID=1955812 RepID=UPI003C733372